MTQTLNLVMKGNKKEKPEIEEKDRGVDSTVIKMSRKMIVNKRILTVKKMIIIRRETKGNKIWSINK